MSVLQRTRNLLRYLRKYGVRGTARYAMERFSENYHEWRLGIQTTGKVRPEELGIDSACSNNYYPSDYRSIYRAFHRLGARHRQGGFLDYGCGKGRVLVVAATFPFTRVIGVELSPDLARLARENINQARMKQRCANVEVVTADAAEYRVPPEVTTIFFYNPFRGPVLAKVLASIGESLAAAPRTVSIVFKNTVHLEPLLKDHTWLIKEQEFPASDSEHTIAVFRAQR